MSSMMPESEFKDYFKTGDEKDFRKPPGMSGFSRGARFVPRFYRCPGCGWEASIKSCPRCQRTDLERVEA